MKFTKLVKMTQKKMKNYLMKELMGYYPVVINEDGFLYAKGTEPCLLTAHMDTVHEAPVRQIKCQQKKNKTILSSPQGIGGDDRCGIFMILYILQNTDYRPSILFCEDEEIGGVGSGKFCKTEHIKDLKELKYFLELDRANDKDLVFYDCGNEDFKKFAEQITGYKEAWGSFSDISHLSPATDVASLNISCGYYKQHTLEEYVVYEEMLESIYKVIDLVEASKDCEKFDYQEVIYAPRYTYSNYYDYFKGEDKLYGMEIAHYDENQNEVWTFVDGESEMECLGRFLYEHPTMTFDDILDYQPYYYEDYAYAKATQVY